MENLNDKEYTYANLTIKRIQRMMMDDDKPLKDYSESDLVGIGLGILRIMTEIFFGDGTEDSHEWDLFFKSYKSKKDFIFFIYHLHQMQTVKNTLLNEVIQRTDLEDLEKFIKEEKGED